MKREKMKLRRKMTIKDTGNKKNRSRGKMMIKMAQREFKEEEK